MADLIVPATKEQMASIQLYADLLGEAKIRIGIINHFITGKAELPGPLIRESAFLQLRMLCELIALGCLVAHGDITRRTKLRKEWSAYRIIAGKLTPRLPMAIRPGREFAIFPSNLIPRGGDRPKHPSEPAV